MNHLTGTSGALPSLRRLLNLAGRPGVQRLLGPLRSGLIGFVLAPAAAGALALPLLPGYLVSLPAEGCLLAAAAGGSAGLLLLWQGSTCLVGLAQVVAVLFGVAAFSGTQLRKLSWFPSLLVGGITALLGMVFLLAERSLQSADVWAYLAQVGAAALSAWVFCQGAQDSPVFRAGVRALICLGLSQLLVLRVVDLGIAAAAFFCCTSPELPMAVLCGLAVDISRITPVPVTPVLCLSLLTATLRRSRSARCLGPVIWSIPAMYLSVRVDPVVPLGLCIGGLAAVPLAAPEPAQRRAVPAAPEASARLEIAAGALDYVRQLLAQPEPGPTPDDQVCSRMADQICRRCDRQGDCPEARGQVPGRLLAEALAAAGDGSVTCLPPDFCAVCPQADAFLRCADRTAAALRLRNRFALRHREERAALHNQYRFLSDYLRDTARTLEAPIPARSPRYRVDLGIAASGKFGQKANGDRGAQFPGPEARYYVILCDGMGAGYGAAGESSSALHLLTGMLRAGMPPEAAMEALNDLYVLRETGGFSTVDLLELRLDTGRAHLYKWGAAVSYLKYRRTARPLGTAAPPPGLGIGPDHRPELIRLTLQRGETLVLVSDGLSGPETRDRIADDSGQDLSALAERLIPQGAALGDDCTAVAVRLLPLGTVIE